MARRAKTPRFKEFQGFPNTSDNFSDKVVIGGDGPYVLELGCGRGEFALALAKRHPKTQFLGIDIKSDRMWFGAKQALEQKIENIHFLRADIKDLNDIFEPESLKTIWLTFPDPYPKKGQSQRRLTHPRFMDIYSRLLEDNGSIKFKTDNDGLFEWSLRIFSALEDWQVVASGRDLHADKQEISDWRIITRYEREFLRAGQAINYLEVRLLS